MNDSRSLTPVAMTIAGSDSGGGAGIQADLRAFNYFGVFGTTVLTAVTAQNPHRVSGMQALPADFIRQQFSAIAEAFCLGAVKTGMLFSAPLISMVSQCLKSICCPVVVDPVMVATSGARLLQQDALASLMAELLPLATIITPNLPEAEILVGRPLDDLPATVSAAFELSRRFGCFVLIKGGHRANSGTEVVDIGSDGQCGWRFGSPAVDTHASHGTGCSLSAAIAACLARKIAVPEAIVQSKAYVLGSLRNQVQVGAATWAMANPVELPVALVSCTEIR